MQKLSLLLLAPLLFSTTGSPTNTERFIKLINSIKTDNSKKFYKHLKRVNIDHRDPSTGATALLWAVLYDRRPMIAEILYRNPDLNCPNYFGTTPLHGAVNNCDYELVAYLVNHGADMHQQNSVHQTARVFAEFEGDEVLEDAEHEFNEIKKRFSDGDVPQLKRQCRHSGPNEWDPHKLPLVLRRRPLKE